MASNASATRPTLADCIEMVLGQLDALAGDVLVALKTAFVRADEDEESEEDNPELQETVKQLLVESRAVAATFASETRRLVYQSGSQDLAQSPLGRVEDIRVFDIRELEAHIELALARQEVMRGVDDVLPLFDSLVSALLGWSTVQALLNPLKPEAFVKGLNETLEAWVPDEPVRMELLRPAAVALGTGLRQLYRETCDWLRSQNIEPVEPPVGKSREGSGYSASAGTEVERTMQTLERLRRLLTGEAFQGTGSGMLRDFTHTVPASLVALQDLKLVEPMVRRLSDRSAVAPAAGTAQPHIGLVRSAPAAPYARTQAQNQQIGRQLGEEVVRFMLDQLVQDERLLLPLRAQLHGLEPVLVELARSDPRFFIDRHHPARRFLDRIAQRNQAFVKEDEEGVAGFVACVASAIQVLARGPGDDGAFADVLDQLEEDWDAFEDMRHRQREQARNARAHAEQRMLLAQRFSGALVERFKNAMLPEVVAAFLRGPWSQVLAEARLGSDETIADPGSYLALVDDLVWSVQPPLMRRDHARLVRLLPRLLGSLGEGLMLIRYPQEPVSIFLDELSALHERIFEGHRAALAAARAVAAVHAGADAQPAAGLASVSAAPDSQPPDSQSMDSQAGELESGAVPLEPPAPERRTRTRARNAAVTGIASLQDLIAGSRVELLLEEVWVGAELTWISHNRNLLMFVSGAGLAHAMSRRTMDRLEAQGRIRVVALAMDVDLELELEDQTAPVSAGGGDVPAVVTGLPRG